RAGSGPLSGSSAARHDPSASVRRLRTLYSPTAGFPPEVGPRSLVGGIAGGKWRSLIFSGQMSDHTGTPVWIFTGVKGYFPGGVFTERDVAESWISKNRLTGTLTLYPVNVGAYEWAIEK